MRDETPIDTLIRGVIGHTGDQVREMRITRSSPWGWVVGYNEETGKQHVMGENGETFEVIGPPRPEKDRRGIPERLR